MRAAAVSVLLLLVAGCGDDMMASRAGGLEVGCHTQVGSVRLEATPATLPRGTADPLTIVWDLDTSVSIPVRAHLSTGPAYAIELTTEMSSDPGEPGRYSAALVNPFGAGTPAGSVTVYTWLGVPLDCPPPLDATTSFQLN